MKDKKVFTKDVFKTSLSHLQHVFTKTNVCWDIYRENILLKPNCYRTWILAAESFQIKEKRPFTESFLESIKCSKFMSHKKYIWTVTFKVTFTANKSRIKTINICGISFRRLGNLNHFRPIFLFDAPWKYQKTFVFPWLFEGYKNRNIIGNNTQYRTCSHFMPP